MALGVLEIYFLFTLVLLVVSDVTNNKGFILNEKDLDRHTSIMVGSNYQAVIKYKGEFVCAGSLISDQYVLTAAHCIYSRPTVPTTEAAVPSTQFTNNTYLPTSSTSPSVPTTEDTASSTQFTSITTLPNSTSGSSTTVSWAETSSTPVTVSGSPDQTTITFSTTTSMENINADSSMESSETIPQRISRKGRSMLFSPSEITVWIGARRLTDSFKAAIFRINPEDITIHPRFSDGRHDIALIRLPTKFYVAGRFAWWERPTPVKLAKPDQKWDLNSVTAWVSGWSHLSSGSPGISNVLSVRKIRLMSREDCDVEYLDRMYELTDSYKICSMDASSRVCFGDDGGPVTAISGWSFYQVGIVSWTTTDNSNCYPGALISYTYLPPYYDWISATITLQDHLHSLD